MSNPFIGEMRLVPFGFAPRGWARCDGATMAINQNQALFAVLGKAFGGNGQTNFQLPDLRGRVPIGAGKTYVAGASGGEELHLLTTNEVPSHTHSLQGLAVAASETAFLAGLFATTASNFYVKPSTNTLALSNPVQSVGGLPHTNMQPFQVITMAIALNGIYPSKN
jgi:microcystin-dependent protein